MAFGKRLRELRQAAGLSQEALGDLAGLSRGYISEIENGKRNVALENIQKLARALKINPARFFES